MALVPKIAFKRRYQELRVYINGSLHILIKTNDLVGVQSWYDNDTNSLYYVELTFKGSDPVLLEYVNRQTWLKILAVLDSAL